MNRTREPLAAWFFERDDQPAVGYQDAVLGQIATLVAEALQVMTVHQILIPERLVLDEWVERGDGAVEFSPLMVPFGSHLNIHHPAAFAAAVLEISRPTGKLPTRLEVSGKTLLLDAEGAGVMVSDAVELRGFAVVRVAIEVPTYVDTWLPYDLSAVEQSEVYQRNAPRLIAVLEELSRLPGITVSDIGMTKYAFTSGFELDNHRDRSGEPVPLLDDMR
ncbi:MAG: hypothetical protein ACRDTG_07330 [Pseudonocardiaceae bacterium]